jgi:restriction system protein
MSARRIAKGPTFLSMLAPVLAALRDLGGSARPQEVNEHVAQALGLDDEAKAALTPSGVPRFYNQVAWARFYLVRSGLLDSSQRGVWSLTGKGQEVKDLTPAQARELVRQVRERMPKKDVNEAPSGSVSGDEEPAPESAATGHSNHREHVVEVLQSLSPPGFERFCQRLLREAGFQNVVVTGRAGDGGIDGMGILRVNTLVSFKVLFQCKRYSGTVSPAHVRDFRGAMMGRADKGIILTTGSFTVEAMKEAVRDGVPPIELVDGEKLATLLEDLEMGLVPVKAFQVDERFFSSFDPEVTPSANGVEHLS